MEQTHPSNYCHSLPYPCIRKTQSLLMPPTYYKICLHNSSSSTSWIFVIRMGRHNKTLVNKIEMVQRRAARFSHNDDRLKTKENGCMSEIVGKLNLEPLNIRRTNRRLTIFHKPINGHFSLRRLPIGHLQPVLRRTRHLHSKAYNIIQTSKDC